MGQMRIDEVTESKSGKAWRVKSGTQWYNAFKDSGIEKLVGQVINAEIETSEKWGPGIKTYKLMDSGAPAQATEPVSMASPSEAYRPAPYWQPFASNLVASCVAQGLIKAPNEVYQWAKAAKMAMESLTTEFDDVQF